MKIIQKGIVRTVGRVQVKHNAETNKETRLQSLIITVPGFVDAFGERKGEDQDWEFNLINDNIDKQDLLSKNLQGKKVILTGYLNSRKYLSSSEERYNLQINLINVEVYNPSRS